MYGHGAQCVMCEVWGLRAGLTSRGLTAPLWIGTSVSQSREHLNSAPSQFPEN